MEFYWRIKKWRVDLDAVFSTPTITKTVSEQFDLYVGTGEARGSFEWDYAGVAASSENSLVCAPGVNWGFSIFENVGQATLGFASNNPTNLPGTVFCLVYGGAVFSAGSAYVLNIQPFANLGLAEADFGFGAGGFEDVQECGSFDVTLSSGMVSAPLYCRFYAGYFINLNISMQGEEWWSYGGTYDTATGLPL